MLVRAASLNTLVRHVSRCAQSPQYHSSALTAMPLSEFREKKDTREERLTQNVGRSWTVKELRRKSFEDLHKLWVVLYKERNVLLTEMNAARRSGMAFPQPDRKQKVKKSMGAIKTVLGERKLDKLSQIALKKMNQEHGKEEEEDESL